MVMYSKRSLAVTNGPTTTPDSTTADADVWLTPADLGALLSVSTGTLGNWRSAGAGPPYVKLGGRGGVRYRRSEALAWLDGQRRYAGGAA